MNPGETNRRNIKKNSMARGKSYNLLTNWYFGYLGEEQRRNKGFVCGTNIGLGRGYSSLMPVFLISLLSYVTELTDRIRARSSPDVDGVEDSADFVSFFPDFVWTLRDFSLDLEVDGQSITADEYLENSLKLKKRKGDLELVNRWQNTKNYCSLVFCQQSSSTYSFYFFSRGDY